ncbi:MAG: flagellin [Pseudomonadota bacterium]
MSISVHTNSSAMVALQNLNATNRDLEATQQRVSTGLKVQGAKDNASVFAVAQNMRGDTAALGVVQASLDRAQSIADVAIAAGETISDLFIQLREKATASMDPSIDAAARSAYAADFNAIAQQVKNIIDDAEFDGANLLNNSLTGGIEFIADADATDTLTLTSEDFSFSGSIISLTSTATLGSVSSSQAALSAINSSLTNINSALARLGASAKQMENHSLFVTKLQDTLTEGVGNLVDADLAKESATLQALQVKQQLGVQALSIANQAPQTLLSLFQ